MSDIAVYHCITIFALQFTLIYIVCESSLLFQTVLIVTILIDLDIIMSNLRSSMFSNLRSNMLFSHRKRYVTNVKHSSPKLSRNHKQCMSQRHTTNARTVERVHKSCTRSQNLNMSMSNHSLKLSHRNLNLRKLSMSLRLKRKCVMNVKHRSRNWYTLDRNLNNKQYTWHNINHSHKRFMLHRLKLVITVKKNNHTRVSDLKYLRYQFVINDTH